MRKSLWIAISVAALALAGALYLSTTGGRTTGPSDGQRSSAGPPSSPGAAAVGAQAPSFALADISGNIVHSSRFAGKPTVVNFFATWCPACREEIPAFVEVFHRYRGKELELVGISLDTDTRESLPAFIAGNGIEYRILLGNTATARAFGGVSALPTTVFIGRDGRIKNIHVGTLDGDTLEREVRKLL